MTNEFERDSRLPFWMILVGVAVACFATWSTAHCIWNMCGCEGDDWYGREASMTFKAVRRTIVTSAMLSGSLAILIRLVRAKTVSALGYLVAAAKLALVLFVAMRMSEVAGLAAGVFVPWSREVLPLFGGWRGFQIAHVITMVSLIPAGVYLAESAQKRFLAARTWLGRGMVCAMLILPCLIGQCLCMLDWVRIAKPQRTEAAPQSDPTDSYRLTEDEPGEVMG